MGKIHRCVSFECLGDKDKEYGVIPCTIETVRGSGIILQKPNRTGPGGKQCCSNQNSKNRPHWGRQRKVRVVTVFAQQK